MEKRIEIVNEISDILANRYGCADIVADILGDICSLYDLEKIRDTLEEIEKK